MVIGSCVECENCVAVRSGPSFIGYGCDATSNMNHSIDIIRQPLRISGECASFSFSYCQVIPVVNIKKEKRALTYEEM
jgi:hypothetical protein